MGTRADFYVGRGAEAEWLGSIAFDGYPKGIDPQVLNCTSPEAFRHAVNALLERCDDGTKPDMGWPWPWDDSHTTDYAYAFDGGVVYASKFGSPWFQANQPEPEERTEGEKPVFPDMKSRQNTAWDKRSGLLIFGIK